MIVRIHSRGKLKLGDTIYLRFKDDVSYFEPETSFRGLYPFGVCKTDGSSFVQAACMTGNSSVRVPTAGNGFPFVDYEENLEDVLKMREPIKDSHSYKLTLVQALSMLINGAEIEKSTDKDVIILPLAKKGERMYFEYRVVGDNSRFHFDIEKELRSTRYRVRKSKAERILDLVKEGKYSQELYFLKNVKDIIDD